MTIATVGALILGEHSEGVAVMLFYQVGEWFQSYAVSKSRRSITSLMDIRPDYANIEKDGKLIQVDPEDVQIGDTIIVKPGERVPLDGKIIKGSSTLDTSALTGESMPREVEAGMEVISGCINQTGILTIQTTKEFGESTVAKILDLVENASDKKGRMENFITRFARYYTPVVVFAALALAVLPPLVTGQAFSIWIYRALTFLVISCPCALVISIPLSFFGGIGGASKIGVLVKGSNYLEALAYTETVVFDKTGTLTKGSFAVTEIQANGMTDEELLELAAYAEDYSNHTISLSIQKAYGKKIDNSRITDVQEIAGHGVQAVISIESQIEFCKYELRGGSCKEYQDKGYSGKNTDRPQFQMLVEDIKRGLFARVVVYKLDRISRSILDFANMMALFQEYNVEFISSTEKFDTSTPMGRAMLNICIVFAQLERETIQKRVQDAWYARCQRGFKMGGRAPYGFRTEPIIIDGIHTKKLVIEPTEAAFVRKMYDMYIDPRISLHDIATQLTAQGVRSFYGKPFSRSTISLILRNPIYAMADLDIYEFFKSQGTEIYNDAADFAGTNGCYYYRSKGNTDNKHKYLQGQMLVLAPSEGFIPSDLWLRVRKKIMASQSYQPARKARNTWMAGKIKCGNCGYALMSAHSCGYLYLRCTKHAENKSCPGCGTVKMRELEVVVYQQMVKKLEDYKTLTGRKKKRAASPKLTAKQAELAQVESEIEKLLDTLVGATPVLISYANAKIEELDSRRQALASEIAKLTAEAVSPEQIDTISNYLDDWENVSFKDKQQVVDLMITVIRATSEKLQIEWKI